MIPNNVEGMSNSGYPDRTAPLGMRYLLMFLGVTIDILEKKNNVATNYTTLKWHFAIISIYV